MWSKFQGIPEDFRFKFFPWFHIQIPPSTNISLSSIIHSKFCFSFFFFLNFKILLLKSFQNVGFLYSLLCLASLWNRGKKMDTSSKITLTTEPPIGAKFSNLLKLYPFLIKLRKILIKRCLKMVYPYIWIFQKNRIQSRLLSIFRSELNFS